MNKDEKKQILMTAKSADSPMCRRFNLQTIEFMSAMNIAWGFDVHAIIGDIYANEIQNWKPISTFMCSTVIKFLDRIYSVLH